MTFGRVNWIFTFWLLFERQDQSQCIRFYKRFCSAFARSTTTHSWSRAPHFVFLQFGLSDGMRFWNSFYSAKSDYCLAILIINWMETILFMKGQRSKRPLKPNGKNNYIKSMTCVMIFHYFHISWRHRKPFSETIFGFLRVIQVV